MQGHEPRKADLPLYEYLFCVAGRPDEVRISDYNSLREGDEIVIASREWVVARLGQSERARPDGVPVQRRITLIPKSELTARN